MKGTREIQPIEYYRDAVYPVTVYPAPEGGYVAEIEDLPGCITEGETLEEVFERIEQARLAWIEVQHENDEEIPLPRTEQQYSGKFLIRIPKTLHRQLAGQAKREGVSLNQYVETILTSKAAMKDIAYELAEKLITIAVKQAGPSVYSYSFMREDEPAYSVYGRSRVLA